MQEFKEDDYLFFVSGNTPSSKNDMRWTGEYLVPSKATQKWLRITRDEWLGQALWFQYMISILPKPYFVKLTFIRKSRHRFDYINAAQIIMDTMTGYLPVDKRKKWIGQIFQNRVFLAQKMWMIDDNSDEIIPYFGKYIYDKERPGCIIEILKQEPNYDL
jgi:hypothetical protein